MDVRGVSKAVCTHSHFLNPLCPHQTLLGKVSNVFLIALAIVVTAVIFRALNRLPPPAPPPRAPKLLRTPKPPEKATPNPLSSEPIIEILPMSLPAVLSSPKITSAEEIGNIPGIVGVSLPVLQRRALPLEQKGDTARGFIENGFLLDVIKRQWGQASAAGITHTAIADHLHYLISVAKAEPSKPISYDPRTKANNPKLPNIPRFIFTFQKKKDTPDVDIFRPENAGADKGASYEEAVIVNTAVQGKYIRWTPIRERYIREFGFYSKGMDFDTVRAVLML